MKRIITGMELGKALVNAGVLPENASDLIIEAPVTGVVTIHFKVFADERILAVIPAKVDPANIQEVPELPVAHMGIATGHIDPKDNPLIRKVEKP